MFLLSFCSEALKSWFFRDFSLLHSISLENNQIANEGKRRRGWGQELWEQNPSVTSCSIFFHKEAKRILSRSSISHAGYNIMWETFFHRTLCKFHQILFHVENSLESHWSVQYDVKAKRAKIPHLHYFTISVISPNLKIAQLKVRFKRHDEDRDDGRKKRTLQRIRIRWKKNIIVYNSFFFHPKI